MKVTVTLITRVNFSLCFYSYWAYTYSCRERAEPSWGTKAWPNAHKQLKTDWLSVYLFYRWEGENENEVGRCKETGKVHVTVDLKYYRPTEVVSIPGHPVCRPILPAGWENIITECPKPTFKDLHWASWHPSVAISQTRVQWIKSEMLFLQQNPLFQKENKGKTHPRK